VLAAGLPARLPGVPAGLPDGAGVPLVAVYHSYESDHRGPYTLTVGVPVSGPVALPDVPELAVVAVPAQRCAHLSADGERPRAVFGAWVHVWEALTPRRSFRADLEVYRPERGDTGAVELYVGLR
jgi:predicted transcriptional regulator YdeE